MAKLTLTAAELANPKCEAHQQLREIADAHNIDWEYCHTVECDLSEVTFHCFAVDSITSRIRTLDGVPVGRVPMMVQV